MACVAHLSFLNFFLPSGLRSDPLQSAPLDPLTNVASTPLSEGLLSNSTSSPSPKLRKPGIWITDWKYTKSKQFNQGHVNRCILWANIFLLLEGPEDRLTFLCCQFLGNYLYTSKLSKWAKMLFWKREDRKKDEERIANQQPHKEPEDGRPIETPTRMFFRLQKLTNEKRSDFKRTCFHLQTSSPLCSQNSSSKLFTKSPDLTWGRDRRGGLNLTRSHESTMCTSRNIGWWAPCLPKVGCCQLSMQIRSIIWHEDTGDNVFANNRC